MLSIAYHYASYLKHLPLEQGSVKVILTPVFAPHLSRGPGGRRPDSVLFSLLTPHSETSKRISFLSLN